jgi:arylsulfatase A-like enzyme
MLLEMGDNGFFLGEHGLAGKWFPYEESVRIPLFIFNPLEKEKNKGRRIRSIALNIDIAPTIIAFAGLKKDPGMQGEPLQNTWKEEDPEWRDRFFYEHRFQHPGLPKSEAVISPNYKYINYYELPDSSREFYDLRNDPGEVTNLINSSDYSEIITDHLNYLDSLRSVIR